MEWRGTFEDRFGDTLLGLMDAPIKTVPAIRVKALSWRKLINPPKE